MDMLTENKRPDYVKLILRTLIGVAAVGFIWAVVAAKRDKPEAIKQAEEARIVVNGRYLTRVEFDGHLFIAHGESIINHPDCPKCAQQRLNSH